MTDGTPAGGGMSPEGTVASERRVASTSLPAELTSAREARRFATEAVPELSEDDRDTLALLVTEVVTNALLHAQSPVELRLELRPGVLRVEVRDGDPTLPTRHDHGESASTGRGMHLVDVLSRAWAAVGDSYGKIVWFELELST